MRAKKPPFLSQYYTSLTPKVPEAIKGKRRVILSRYFLFRQNKAVSHMNYVLKAVILIHVSKFCYLFCLLEEHLQGTHCSDDKGVIVAGNIGIKHGEIWF